MEPSKQKSKTLSSLTSPIAIKSNDGFLYVIMPMRKN